MAFDKIKPKTKAKAPVEPPADYVSDDVDVEVVEATTTELATQADFGAANSIMARLMENQKSAVTVMESAVSVPSGGVLFPIMRMDVAGSFDEPYGAKEGVDYPTGKKGFGGIILAWRFASLIWPEVYKEGSGKQKPLHSAMVPGHDALNAELVLNAARALQFTKSVERAEKFDPPDGPGCPVAGIEFLVYCGEAGHLIVVEVPTKYQSVANTKESLESIINQEIGAVPPIPFLIRPRFEKKEINGYTIKNLWVTFEAYSQGNPATMMQEFAAYMKGLSTEEIVSIEKWIDCTDRPLGTTHRHKLLAAVDINPPR